MDENEKKNYKDIFWYTLFIGGFVLILVGTVFVGNGVDFENNHFTKLLLTGIGLFITIMLLCIGLITENCRTFEIENINIENELEGAFAI